MPLKRKAVQLTLIEHSEPVPRSKGGCPQDTVWTHFIQTPLAIAEHKIRRVFVRNILHLYGNDDDIIDDENNKYQNLISLILPIFGIMNITNHYQNQDKTR
ncbi:unnamed protein product [Rhizophagus irregularis]|nr:unnamed protein product [Rhizophagus irregularis]